MQQLHKTKQKGFTLIEALVATAIFAFVISSVVGIYLATLRLDTRTRAERTVSQNARFMMEYLAKEIRNGSIDYASYSDGTANETNELFLINQLNESERIFLNGENLVLSKTTGTTNLNSSKVRVTRARFHVGPVGEPYSPTKTYNQQPHVTVILQLTSNYGNRPGDVAVGNFQSTFTVRVYPARL